MEAKQAVAAQATLAERVMVYSMVAASCIAFVLVLAAQSLVAPLRRP